MLHYSFYFILFYFILFYFILFGKSMMFAFFRFKLNFPYYVSWLYSKVNGMHIIYHLYLKEYKL